MNEILQFKIGNTQLISEDFINSLTAFYEKIIEKAIELGVWSETIKSIIITDDFKNEIEKQAYLWKIETKLSQEKEFSVYSKILFNGNCRSPEYIIFIHFKFLFYDSLPHFQQILGQIINIYAKWIIPIDIREKNFIPQPFTLNSFIQSASTEWCTTVYARNLMKKIFTEPIAPINHNSFLIGFKRKLKKNLYEYNSDKLEPQENLNQFWFNYFDSIDTYLLRLCENETEIQEFHIKESEPSKNLAYHCVEEIKKLTEQCTESKSFDISGIKEAIKQFSAYFEVFLEDETDINFRIRLTKNPKEYFIDEIVETEPRIVCFIDILGFSELIKIYDSDLSSTILQDIQESFSITKLELIDSLKQQNKDLFKHLKYQTFSDNICISIPYFDNELDFITNFNFLSLYVRGFQSVMMSKGFYTRGGISLGSYYTDNNIIFSKGLVNAYFLESKKAIFPRVVIDKIIIDKLLNYNPKQIKFFGLDKIIVFDWEQIAFINPFGIVSNSINQFQNMVAILDKNIDDPLVNSITSISKSISNTTIDFLKSVSEDEKRRLSPIKSNILENIYTYKNDENIVSKYLWLLEFIKWFENDDTAKLKFQYMTELLKPID